MFEHPLIAISQDKNTEAHTNAFLVHGQCLLLKPKTDQYYFGYINTVSCDKILYNL